MIDDIRHGLRALTRHPGFSIVAALTLAAGIGASSTIFSAVYAVAIEPLPYREPGRLAVLWTDDPKHDIHEEGTSYLNFLDWKNQNHAFEDLAICSRNGSVTISGSGEPEHTPGEWVSENLFPLLGVAPILGRTFSADEAARAERVVVISEGLWRRRFGGSRDAIAQTIEIDGTPRRILGVMPARFQFPAADTALWLPYTALPAWSRIGSYRFNDWWRVVARLKPAVTAAQAQAEMDTIGRRLAAAYPATDAEFAGFGVNVVPLRDQVTPRATRLALWLLFAAVVLVLLIACANVAGLLLARGLARQREIAIRGALGASRARLIRRLLIESAILSLAAGAAGLLLAVWGVWAVGAFGPKSIARLAEVRINGAVLVFNIAVSLITALLFGIAPASRLSRSDLNAALKESGKDQSRQSSRLRDALVVAEFALAIVLLSGAGLLVRSLLRIQSVNPGFRSEQTLLARISVSKPRAQALAFYQALLDRVGRLPGVVASGLITDAFQRRNPDNPISIEGRPIPPNENTQISDDWVSPGFFPAIGATLLRGRFFSAQDQSAPVAIINDTMARRFWPGEDPIGKRFKLAEVQSKRPWREIVGVVGDMRREGLEKRAIAQTFLPFDRNDDVDLVVRTSSNPLALAGSMRAAVHAIDPTAPVYEVSTLEQRLSEYESPRRFQTVLMTLFSALALLLSAIGVYGLIHQSVAQRTRELGIRMALGAQPGDVLSIVLRHALGLALAGAAFGVASAFALTRIMAGLLYEVKPADLATFVSAPILLLAVALAASALPARRASRIDPIAALRYE